MTESCRERAHFICTSRKVTPDMALEMTDLYWAAGFLEGEGTFTASGTTPVLHCSQVQKYPLEKLQGLFGGKIEWLFHKQGIWRWRLPCAQSAGVMMTLYTLMSPRRKFQIEQALMKFKSSGHRNTKENRVCKNGHAIVGDNVFSSSKGVVCKKCRSDRTQEYHVAWIKKFIHDAAYRESYFSARTGKTCKYGHAITPENTFVSPTCVACALCKREWGRRSAQRKRAKANMLGATL